VRKAAEDEIYAGITDYQYIKVLAFHCQIHLFHTRRMLVIHPLPTRHWLCGWQLRPGGHRQMVRRSRIRLSCHCMRAAGVEQIRLLTVC
jgi:hypothetical protein